MNEQDERIRTELMEGMLEYIEGRKSFRSVLAIGITASNNTNSPSPVILEVISELDTMSSQLTKGKKFSREYIKEAFTTMLENLAR